MDKSKIKAIIENGGTKALYDLTEDELEYLMIDIWLYFTKKPYNELTEVQKTLFLAMTLENVCQADTILNLYEYEDILNDLPSVSAALETLGAFKTAALFKEFISYIPEGTVLDTDSFFEFFIEDYEEEWEKANDEICNYPDGHLMPLYIKYALRPENVGQLLTGLHG